jgi:predicted transcriptional regulator
LRDRVSHSGFLRVNEADGGIAIQAKIRVDKTFTLAIAKVAKGNTWEYQMPTRSTTSLKLDSDIKDRIHRLADSRRRSPHWVMCEAVEQYVEREEKRESFRQDALAAWASYEMTGLHVTAEEADTWLAKLEAGEDAEAPEGHV